MRVPSSNNKLFGRPFYVRGVYIQVVRSNENFSTRPIRELPIAMKLMFYSTSSHHSYTQLASHFSSLLILKIPHENKFRVVYIFIMTFHSVQVNFYHLEYSDYCFYNHNVSADLSSDFLRMFLIERKSFNGTSNRTLDCPNSVNHDRVQVLNNSKYSLLSFSQHWTCNFKMISIKSSLTNPLYLLYYISYQTSPSGFLRLINLMFLSTPRITTYY